jgi:hypothetical protein
MFQVEQAFRLWSTGEYNPDGLRFAASEWASQTQDILVSIKKLKDRTWQQIVIRAMKEMGKHRKLSGYGSQHINRMVAGCSG